MRSAAGFTLLELSVVLFIIGLIITIAMPYAGSYRKSQLKSEARRLAGRASYLFDEAESQKVVMQLAFDLDHSAYAVLRLDPYSATPAFVPERGAVGRPVQMPAAVAIRDVTVGDLGTFYRGIVATQFYPEGYVDATLVHLVDASGHVVTLDFNSLTGQVLIGDGDFSPADMLAQ
ncbi:MAG TPA: prepilin-type N-terminal cleavage/methylation domain-containing protein [Candidatus Binataceae bacterium]|nr:prepilin-type N-terminal cleavage/methylation domain-containing protein [Candidatus Binataceae bacterium]